MKGICRFSDLLGLVCFLLVTKPVIGYNLLQSTTSSKTSSVHFRRNEERQQIHNKVPWCFNDNISTAFHAQRRSGQHVAGPRTLPIQGFITHHRLPLKERSITPRQEIFQFLRPPPVVPSNRNTNTVYFTTATPIAGNKIYNQAFRPASPLPSQFKPLQSNAVSPVNSAVHKTSVTSTTASPSPSLGSYSSGSHQPHTQKIAQDISNTGTSTQTGSPQQSTVFTIPRPVHPDQPRPQQKPSPPKPLAPVSNDNTKQSHPTNTFEHVIIPQRISGQPSRPPEIISDSKQHINIPQTDNINRENYHITKPVVENNSDSKPNLPLKSDNGQNSTQQKRQDLKLAGNELGYFYPGVQTTGPVGQLGLAPYGLDFVRLEEHHNPIENSLLISSMWNPGLRLGLGGVGNGVPYRYGSQFYGRDPLMNLLLKTYAKYLPYGLGSYGLYSYSSPSHIDNSKPFGLYKYENRI